MAPRKTYRRNKTNKRGGTKKNQTLRKIRDIPRNVYRSTAAFFTQTAESISKGLGRQSTNASSRRVFIVPAKPKSKGKK
jgi:hypothetical protein